MDQAAKTLESLLRRVARRRGLIVERCPRRDPDTLGYGRYRLVDVADRNIIRGTGGQGGYGLTLDELQQHPALAGAQA
jgi:hypothetical protein